MLQTYILCLRFRILERLIMIRSRLKLRAASNKKVVRGFGWFWDSTSVFFRFYGWKITENYHIIITQRASGSPSIVKKWHFLNASKKIRTRTNPNPQLSPSPCSNSSLLCNLYGPERNSDHRVADPHHINAEPQNCNADPNPDQSFHFNADPDPTFHFNANMGSAPNKSYANLR